MSDDNFTLESQFTAEDVVIEKEEVLYQGFNQLKKVYFKHKLFRGGFSNTIERELLIKKPAVAVIAYDPIEDAIVMVEQIRIGAYEHNDKQSPWLLELIAGMVEEGEDLAEVAVRESREEANIELMDLEHVLTIMNSPGSTVDRVHIFFACVDSKKASGVYGLATENEDIRVRVISRTKGHEMVKNYTINNTLAVVGIQWLMINYTEITQKYSKLTF